MLQSPGIKPLLLLAAALLPNRTTESFESEAGPPYDKQRIQMGLSSGNTVLICFRSGVGHHQSVLIALAADLHTNKPWQGQHKFWKYVSPIRTQPGVPFCLGGKQASVTTQDAQQLHGLRCFLS